MMSRATIAAAMLTGWMLLTTPVWAASFLFNTGACAPQKRFAQA